MPEIAAVFWTVDVGDVEFLDAGAGFLLRVGVVDPDREGKHQPGQHEKQGGEAPHFSVPR
jgi:hypothetical protein